MNIINGVIMVAGSHGVGKSRFALEAGNPEKTILIDDDQKGKSTVQRMLDDGIKFGEYVDFIKELSGKKPVDIHKKGLEIIDAIPQGKYEVLVWDTWKIGRASCRERV